MKERKAWTKQEDEILRHLRQTKGQKKWSAIAKKMEEQFSISGRSGKQCRQRYHNHLDSAIKTSEWTPQQERVLFQMHDQVGNRWSVISHHLPGRTDNCVKNHFYSKLRKAVRRINKVISQKYKKEYKQIKTSLLYKIIETSQSKFKVSSMVDQQIADFCSDIKNKLYYFQQNFEQNNQQHIQALKLIIQDILNFGKNDKRVKVRSRKSSGASKDLLHPNMYLKKVRSNSQYSQSDLSSRYIQSSSYGDGDGDQSDNEQNISIGHKSMMQISKRQTNPSKSYTTNTNLRLTRSRSKQETFSSNKSPDCFSDDVNLCTEKAKIQTFTGDNFHLLNQKFRFRNPSFEQQKSQWSQHAIEQMLVSDNIIQEKSSGSNKLSRNSRSNSLNRSHVNLFFEDSQFQMRILSPKNFHQQKMSEQGELFDEPRMQIQVQMDRLSQDSIKTYNLGNEIRKFEEIDKYKQSSFQQIRSDQSQEKGCSNFEQSKYKNIEESQSNRRFELQNNSPQKQRVVYFKCFQSDSDSRQIKEIQNQKQEL